MNPLARLGTAVLLALLPLAPAVVISADKRDVVAQDLKNLRVPGKVEAALWTRRSDFYTLQLVLTVDPLANMRLDGEPKGERKDPKPFEFPKIQVWLLREDGTVILPRRTEFPNPARIGLRTRAMDATYSFPTAAGTEGVAMAIRVDEAVYIDKLERFSN